MCAFIKANMYTCTASDDIDIFMVLFLCLIQGVVSDRLPRNTSADGSASDNEYMNVTNSSRGSDCKTTNEKIYCCHNPIYTIVVLARVLCIPTIFCVRCCWMKRKARQQMFENRRCRENDTSSIFTIEYDNPSCTVYGPPPAYDTCSVSHTTEPPPPYDSPPPYKAVGSDISLDTKMQ